MRVVAGMVSMVLCVFLSAAAHASINTKSSKYAAFVMDADTGEVFYERNAAYKRYPASLTKMMTLYMTFEALNKGQIRMNTPLPVSAFAASQPQTNISLKKGQTIRVHDAIKALVVRSANDVSVVLAEALGKSQRNFAVKMTQKARSLGMSKTQFRNPHGLPDRQQYTTARDMAKLSVALRRDFPQHYHLFKTKEFTWKGRTYTSHNRVLDQFDGVDGIKTGYINMSGFNLASSVKRDGYHIVAVVMGGQTGRVRDAHMVSLLTNTFTQIAERGDEPRMFAALPPPTPRPGSIQTASASPLFSFSFNSGESELTPSPKEEQMANVTVEAAQLVEVREVAPIEPDPRETKPILSFNANPTPDAPRNSLNFQLSALDQLKNQPAAREKWGIQVGAFRNEEAALKAASKAVQMARGELKYSRIDITDNGRKQASIHRARLANLTESQAKRACQALSKQSTPCFVFRLDQRNL